MARTTLTHYFGETTPKVKEDELAPETSSPTALEEELLTRSKAFHKVYQSIMDKVQLSPYSIYYY